MNTSPSKTIRMLRMPDLSKKTGKSPSSLYDLLNPKSKRHDPTFPKQRSLGRRTVAWYEHEIDAWLLARCETTPDRNQARHEEVAK